MNERAKSAIMHQTVDNAYRRLNVMVLNGSRLLNKMVQASEVPTSDPLVERRIIEALPAKIFVEAIDRLFDSITDQDNQKYVLTRILKRRLGPNEHETVTAVGLLCVLLDVATEKQRKRMYHVVNHAGTSRLPANRAAAHATAGVFLVHPGTPAAPRACLFAQFLRGFTDPHEAIREDASLSGSLLAHDLTPEENTAVAKEKREPPRKTVLDECIDTRLPWCYQ